MPGHGRRRSRPVPERARRTGTLHGSREALVCLASLLPPAPDRPLHEQIGRSLVIQQTPFTTIFFFHRTEEVPRLALGSTGRQTQDK